MPFSPTLYHIFSGIEAAGGDFVTVSKILRTLRLSGPHLEHWRRKKTRPKVMSAAEGNVLNDRRFDTDMNAAVDSDNSGDSNIEDVEENT
jgi:hypothetical protein